MVWKPKQMRIWVSTENSRGPEIRPDGGRRDTNSFHAGLRLTKEKRRKQTLRVREKSRKIKRWERKSVTRNHSKNLFFVTFLLLTGEDYKEDDGNIYEKELEVSKVTEDLRKKNSR